MPRQSYPSEMTKLAADRGAGFLSHLLLTSSMRLTAELVRASPAFINPVKDRELDLRGTSVRGAPRGKGVRCARGD